MTKYKHFHRTRVVSRDFIKDFFQTVRSLFGMRLKGYEDRAKETIELIMKDIEKEGNIKWHRINMQEVQDGILVNIYGEYK